MNKKYVLGVDFGGGASKATLLCEDGTTVAENAVEYPTIYPHSGYAEQAPSDWYGATKDNIAALIKKSGVSPENIVGVALDAATHTAVLLDCDYKVLCNAIYWTDSRSVEQTAYLRQKFGDEIKRLTLHEPDTVWTLPQLMWIRDNNPNTWAKCRKIMFAKDYVRYLLTGVYCTDYIEAQGSMLYDCENGCWSQQLCDILGIDKNMLPPVVSPEDIIGGITAAAAADTGLAKSTPVLCGTTDTVMEVLASGAVLKKQMTVKLATAGRICVITDRAYPDKNLINYSHVVPGLWYPGTATKSAAASYRWFRDTFGCDYKTADEAALTVPPGADGMLFHPYLNGELTPYADPLLRASFTGIRAGHGMGHFCRAVMEGVAFSLLECINALEQTGIPHLKEATIIGGGAKSAVWRQITADMLGMKLYQNENSDSSLGSAMLAGVSCGLFSDLADALSKCTKRVSVTTPNMDNHNTYAEIYGRYKRIHDALEPVYADM